MGYPRDLDEYSDYEILLEFRRRSNMLKDHCCTYCCQKFDLCNCRMKTQVGHGITTGSLPFSYSEYAVKFNDIQLPKGPQVDVEIIM